MVFKKNRSLEDEYLEKAIQGNEAALEYLVNVYQDMAYTIAVRIVQNSEDAEEVVQDSFMKAFNSLEQFKRASKFSTWLYRIVYNTALTKINARALPTTPLEEDTERMEYAQEDDTWNRLIEADRKKYVEMALGCLKEEDRLILTLYYIAEKSIQEITEILDMKSSAVKMRLLRGRKQLEIRLKQTLNKESSEL